jgi:putative SOS response-associated peptidase YedK
MGIWTRLCGIMCGRYSLACIDNLCGRFRIIDPTIGFRSHFNIAPGSTNPVIVVHERAESIMMQWGLVPHWAKDVSAWPTLFRLPVMWGQLVPHSTKDVVPTHRPFNARAETLTENKMFRELLRGNRCLVPASGFFEWKHEDGRKVPFYVHVKDDPVFGFAGLYDIWHNPAGVMLQTYTIITTASNDLMAPIHNRMPVILRQDDEMRWLSRDVLPADEMHRILAPYPAEGMEAYPVSERVNSTAVDDGRLIEPVKGL